MTYPRDRSTSSDRPKSMATPPDQATAEAADCPAQQPNLSLEIQALQILDSSDDCIKVLDLEGNILFMNRGGQALLDIEDITLFLYTSWVNFWQSPEQPAVIDAIAQARAGKVCTFQGYCPTLSGEPKWWESKISPMQGIEGQVEQLLCISRDITERRQIEAKRQQAEEKSRESEERYQAIINQAVTGVVCADLDGRLTLVNQKYCDITGYSAHELTQLRMQDITHPEDLPHNIELFDQMRSEGIPFEIEKRYIRKDGSVVWVNNSVSVLRDRNGQPESAVAIVLDITDRKQAELSAELLAIVTQTLAEATCIEEIIQTVGEQLNRYLHISNCAFVEINENTEQATIAHSWHREDVPSLVGIYHLPEFVAGEFFQIAKIGQPIIVQDVATDSRITDSQRFIALKIGSFINIPLIRDHQWKFTLGIYHPTPYNWSSDEIELMHELANRVWTKLERTRVEIALRQNQEMFSALVADAPFGVYMIDAEFCVQQANQTAIATFNIDPLIGRDLAEALRIIWQEPFATEAIDRFCHTLISGESYYSPPMVEPRADITEIQSYDWQIHRITLSNGCYGVVCYFYDLSEIKRAETLIRQAGDRDALRVALNDALRPLTDAIAIQATANRVLGEYLGANRVTYFEVRGAEYVVEQDYVNGVPSLRGGYPIESFGAELLAVYRSGQTAMSTDVAIDSYLSPDQRSAYAGIQIAAYIGVPLVKQGKFVAGLAVHSDHPRQWTPHEIALAEEVAERTWAAVERARAEAALRASEAKYRSLFESIDEGFCLIEVLFDPWGQAVDYRFLEANPAFAKHTGLADVIGKTVRELVPQHEAYWFEIYGRIALTGIPERFENAAQGLGRFYDVYAFRMGEPQECKVAVLFNDISQRKQVEAALRDSESRFRMMVESATDFAIFAMDLEGVITSWNSGAKRLLGYEESEILGQSGSIIFTAADLAHQEDIQERQTVLQQGRAKDVRWHIRKNGSQFWASGLMMPLRDDAEEICGFLKILQDMTTQQQAEAVRVRLAEEREQLLQQEQTARAEAEQANRIKDEFLAVLSHELRSPLNPILGWTRLLQNGKLDAVRQREALATIERNAKLQTQLIDDLLDISRIMRGKLSLTVASVSLPYVIAAALETVRLAAEAKHIQIRLDLAPAVTLISGDAARLQQVIWNLLTNAVKFTPNGGQVTVELRQLHQLAQIRVIDTGKGINPQFLPYVFEYFRQEDGSTTRKFGGLGLGLAIVRQIVEMHGGTVWVESQGEGQGATFIVQLPMLPQKAIVSEPIQAQSNPGMPLVGIHILLVDDEPDTRKFQAFLLEQSGARVTAVASGLAALQALEQLIPDVIVSDIGMAEMDGYMLLQHIRSRPSKQGGMIPAIALTAYATEMDQQRAIQVGFQRHITKPVEPTALIAAIVGLLDRS
ncbi:PAS domain S-box protein [Pantanalinema sp. GBBB05]|uniref:PAS domain S-box protein n=1 Tax=Pantanalinema sp. GBBB05 TaxID=2604139 RepID=UPI001DBBF296|nr:PAS domain S-box protein [Pantanalinema sp. GBBB05]